MKAVKPLLLASLAALPSLLLAEVEMTNLFSDNMVLQRELPVPVWGTADPGEEVTVSFAGQIVEGTADESGKWMVKLAPLETSREGQTLTVKASNTLTFSGVLVGEVRLCSGQSNMQGRSNPHKGRFIPDEYFKRDLSTF